ncbi:MAG TPA: LuxR C-terminal-related transcriptional regulator [Chloroflexota bacterium]|nr:LuxR C-terminal-related transcriptional regulator [Chloroflexota bacterium]
MPWYVWIVVAVVALAAELFSLGLVFAGLALAAVVAAGLSPVLPLGIQLAAFVVLSAGFLLGVRPLILPLLPGARGDSGDPRVAPAIRFGTVVDRVDRVGGQIRVGRGEFWTARTLQPEASIEPGTEVEIAYLDGLTAVVEPVSQPAPATPALPGGTQFGLSSRELEVLRLVARGMTNAQIAQELVLSPRTVHHHVEHILDKMDADSRVDAVRRAIASGLIRADAAG